MDLNNSERQHRLILSKTLVIQDVNIPQMIDRFMPKILGMTQKMGVEEYLDDIVQEVYIRLIQKNKTEDIENIHAYMLAVLRIVILEYCRKRQKRKSLFKTVDEEVLGCQKAMQEDPFLNAEIAEEKAIFYQKVSDVMEIHLSETQREIIRMKYFEKKSYKQISIKLNKQETAIRKSASRAISKLKALLL